MTDLVGLGEGLGGCRDRKGGSEVGEQLHLALEGARQLDQSRLLTNGAQPHELATLARRRRQRVLQAVEAQSREAVEAFGRCQFLCHLILHPLCPGSGEPDCVGDGETFTHKRVTSQHLKVWKCARSLHRPNHFAFGLLTRLRTE